ncbi:MAG TPA: polyamine ABC transporter substrate-binding protein [Pseudomonadales bacterium]|jgi:putrescine transport system substrate-binding protein|nr:polyamine ABC transporter substrate-binding protein [Pseudomonadales bacterium]MDP6317161.1 polyamine ABC transporter substrate-binding protein [Pseudomonadales bacterium]MDP7314049.1 polyamine ABC transporter substrate-binding protein [Pseudomonadales bacterium]HJL61589.1 polyamine ABC transporter substrate-binding protein [Pseudomonadales bacterium]HJP49791.1 polyamine ABC transporter substrate-binding protein [Pseudomonadales bacterium]|tara:strand:+ start:3818 stop:4930 length:1113 start_codon:yes stop_codon:yes gene_type:complete
MNDRQTRKKALLGLLVFLMQLAPVCIAESNEAVLNLYNWVDYIGESTLKDFEREYGIKINYDVYDTTEIVDAKLMAGNSGYDVIVHSAGFSSRLIPIGLYHRLERDKLANWNNLDPSLLESVAEYDPGNQFGIPYMWGTTGFTYNRDMIIERMKDAPLNSAELVFNPAVVSRFADCGVSLLDSPTDVIPMALVYLGYDADSIEPEHLKAAEDLLRSIRPYIKYFNSTKLLIDLPSKEVCIAMSWSGDYSVASRRAKEAGIEIDLGYNIPTEGSLIWFDALYIPADARHVENAYLFLDYLMRPEVIADITDFTGYANANSKATALVNPKMTSDPAIYPGESVLKRLYAAKVYMPKLERLRSRVWTRIKSGL